MARHNSMHLKIHASDIKTKTLEPSAVSIPWPSRQCVPMSLKKDCATHQTRKDYGPWLFHYQTTLCVNTYTTPPPLVIDKSIRHRKQTVSINEGCTYLSPSTDICKEQILLVFNSKLILIISRWHCLPSYNLQMLPTKMQQPRFQVFSTRCWVFNSTQTLPIYKNVPKQTLPQCGTTHHNEVGDPTWSLPLRQDAASQKDPRDAATT